MRAAKVPHLRPFRDWDANAEVVPPELTSQEFVRKMWGAILLLVPDGHLRAVSPPTYCSIEEIEYWGVRHAQWSELAADITCKRPPQLVLLYAPGGSIGLRYEFSEYPPLPPDAGDEAIQRLVLEKLRLVLRVPYRIPAELATSPHGTMSVVFKEYQVDETRVWSGAIKIGKQPVSGVDPDQLPKDTLFDDAQFTLIASEPAVIGFSIFLPDPDESGWATQRWVVPRERDTPLK